MTRHWWTAAACAMATTGAAAQETASENAMTLPTLRIEADDNAGFFGETFAQSAGAVMKTDTPILETPRSVSVVTQEEMQVRGARSVTQALQYTPGVFAGTYGLDNRGDWSLVRGFDPSTFLDGLQAQFGYYNGTRPETFLLDSVAVLKGPSGMLYGNGSVGGVINLNSKLPDPLAPNLVELEFGSHDLFQANLDVGGELAADGSLRYRLVALGRTANGQVDFTGDNARAVMPSLTWTPDPATSVTLLGLWQKTETNPMIQFYSTYGTLWPARPFGNGNRLPPDAFVGEPDFDKYDGETRAATLFASHRFSPVWSVDRLAALPPEQRRLPAGLLGLRQLRDRPLQSRRHHQPHRRGGQQRFALLGRRPARQRRLQPRRHRARRDDRRRLHRRPLQLRLWLCRDRRPDRPVRPGLYRRRAGRHHRLSGVFAEAAVGLRPGPHHLPRPRSPSRSACATTGSSRTPRPGTTAPRSSGSTTASSPPAPPCSTTSATASCPTSAIRNPSPRRTPAPTAPATPSSRPAASRSRPGVKYQPPGTASLLTAAVFEITKSNLLQPDPLDPNFSVQTGEAKARGLELGAQAAWRGFTLDAGYTWLDTEDDAGDALAGVPRNQASAWLEYALAGRLSGLTAGFGVRYVGSTESDDVASPSFTLYDAMLGYQWDRYQVMLTGRNLADTTYVTACDSSTCYYGETRTIGLSLSAAF